MKFKDYPFSPRFVIHLLIVLLITSIVSTIGWLSLPYSGSTGGDDIADGAIGCATWSASQKSTYTGYIYFDTFITITPGRVNYAHVYIDNSGGDTICLSSFQNDYTELASCTISPEDDTAGWYTCQLDSEIILSEATTYKLGYAANTTGGELAQGDTGDDWDWDTNPYSCGQDIEGDDGDANMTADMSIYLDNDITCAACE